MLICFSVSLFSQINESDSTVQVISYWDKNEKQTYLVTSSSMKIKDEIDTTEHEIVSYKVDMEVIDSTENSYTIKWRTYDINTDFVEEEMMKEIYQFTGNATILFKTNELGEFEEILNVDEIRQSTKKGFDFIRKKFYDIEGMDAVIDNLEKQFTSDEVIQSNSAEMINLLLSFHGVKYKLGEELNVVTQQANMLGGDPFDSHMTVLLDDIDVENDLFIMRMWLNVDEKQLTDAVIQYMRSVAKNLGLEDTYDIDNLPKAVNQTRLSSQIHGSTGWPIYCIQTKEVVMANIYKLALTLKDDTTDNKRAEK